MANYLTYSKFYTEAASEELSGFLAKHHIDYIIERDKDVLDKIYIGESLDPMVLLKIKDTDFTIVNDLVKNEFVVDISRVDTSYYLLNFSDNELQDVVNSPAEWNYFDRALAMQLLRQRNVPLVETHLVEQLVKYTPTRISMPLLLLEYIGSIGFIYVGIVIGLGTLLATKTQPNGRSAKMFDQFTRQHGIALLCIGVVRTLIFYMLVLKNY